MVAHTVKSGAGWSVQELSDEFGIARTTVRKVLRDIERRGDEIAGNYKTYRICDVAFALGDYCRSQRSSPVDDMISINQGAMIGFEEGQIHPDELPPEERDKWYAGETKRKKLLKEDSMLVPVREHREGLAEFANIIKTHLVNQVDSMDAAFNLPAEVLNAIDKENRIALNAIADKMSGIDTDHDDEADD